MRLKNMINARSTRIIVLTILSSLAVLGATLRAGAQREWSALESEVESSKQTLDGLRAEIEQLRTTQSSLEPYVEAIKGRITENRMEQPDWAFWNSTMRRALQINEVVSTLETRCINRPFDDSQCEVFQDLTTLPEAYHQISDSFDSDHRQLLGAIEVLIAWVEQTIALEQTCAVSGPEVCQLLPTTTVARTTVPRTTAPSTTVPRTPDPRSTNPPPTPRIPSITIPVIVPQQPVVVQYLCEPRPGSFSYEINSGDVIAVYSDGSFRYTGQTCQAGY